MKENQENMLSKQNKKALLERIEKKRKCLEKSVAQKLSGVHDMPGVWVDEAVQQESEQMDALIIEYYSQYVDKAIWESGRAVDKQALLNKKATETGDE